MLPWTKFSEEYQERRAQSLEIISRKLMQMKDWLTYPLDAIEIISTWDETFQAETPKPEYVKYPEQDNRCAE